MNLVARLCGVAVPNELVVALPLAGTDTERVELRGIADAVPIERVAVS